VNDCCPPKPKRRWYQFSLMTMLVLMALFSLLLGVTADRARKREQALRTVRELGGTVFYNHDAPEWVRRCLGDNWFSSIIAIDLSPTGATDVDLEQCKQDLTDIDTLAWIRLSGTEVTEAGVMEFCEALPDVNIFYSAGPARPLPNVGGIPMSWGEDPWRSPRQTVGSPPQANSEMR
jgi:hypothetical protein